MLITLYTPVGIVYQKFNINEYDIINGDLLKYINLPKNKLFDELDETFEETDDKVFIKTIINLFNNENSKEIKIDDEINGDEFTILFSYEYYIYNDDEKYKKIENNIKNCDNINSVNGVIKNDPYQIIFINSDNEKYYENCKLAVENNGCSLQCINPELRTDEICKLSVQQNGLSLQYVKEQTSEICKLAVQQDGYSLYYVQSELMNEEICKFAVQERGSAQGIILD